MIPFVNVLAGILIGAFNDTWLARLLAPFVWGVVFCIYISIVERKRRDAFIAHAEMNDRKARWGMSHMQAFYFTEYMTSTLTSLTFSIISGFIKGLF